MSDALKQLIEAVEASDKMGVLKALLDRPVEHVGLADAAFNGDFNAALSLKAEYVSRWLLVRLAEEPDTAAPWKACLRHGGDPDQEVWSFDQPHPARALLLAILRAYQQVQA